MRGKNGFLCGALGLGLITTAGCSSLSVKRDFGTTKPGVVVYDDMCGLQDYFDALKDSTIATPREVFAQDLAKDEKGEAMGGMARFRYDTEFQLHHVRKLLAANWSSVPAEVQKADVVELEVRWSKRAGVKRVVTEEAAQLVVGPKAWELPYHVCLSDFIYGEDLYNTRRVVLQLPDPPRSPFSKKPVAAVGPVATNTFPAAAPSAAPPAAATVAAPVGLTPPPAAPAVVAPPPSAEPAAPAPPAVH